MADSSGAELLERLQAKPVVPESLGGDVVYAAMGGGDSIRVVRRCDSMNRVMLTYHTCDTYTQSVLYPEEPLRDLQGLMYLVPALLHPPGHVLVLGSAAGGCLRQIEATYPTAKVTAVDLDPRAHEVAKQVFEVDTRQSTLVTADARSFADQCTQAFDLIIIDLFAGTSMPAHCLVQGFFERMYGLLTENGGLFLNTNMDDLPFEVMPPLDPFRPIRHLQSTLASSGFQTILENSYFNSLFAFRAKLPIATFRRLLFERADDQTQPRALRAGAGLAAFTTAEAQPKPERYRPFGDDWSPAFAPMSVRAHIYLALRAAGVEQRFHELGSDGKSVPERVLRARFEEWDSSGEPALRNLGALIGSLNEVEGVLPRDAIDTAAKFFRFRGRLSELEVTARSPWARLAWLYSQLYMVAYQNDYESLAPILEDLRRLLGTEQLEPSRGMKENHG